MNEAAVRGKEELLERRALHGLMCEWESAVSDLPDRDRARMRLPIFAWSDGARQWGAWNGERREISIRRSLFWEYPWASVREVLRHETAHQLADEVWGGDATPHGGRFREACRLLQADPVAAEDFVPVAVRERQGPLRGEDRILRRVRKLLALAQSDHRHEAEAAMAKAHEQIARHNIDLLASREARAYGSACVGEPTVRRRAHESALAALLCDFYFVEGIWLSAYVLRRGRMGRILEISGRPENVTMAGYVHGFLRRTLDEQWRAFNAEARLSESRKVDFGVGLIRGFRQTLESQRRGWAAASRSAGALIPTRDTRLDAYFRARYPRIRRSSGWRRMVDRSVQQAGERVGRATVLSRPIESGARGRKLLPAAGHFDV